jgi:hypothetical protein
VRSKQAGHSHCLTAPHSSNHKDSQMWLRNIRESKTISVTYRVMSPWYDKYVIW